jgi:hypothetical protein
MGAGDGRFIKQGEWYKQGDNHSEDKECALERKHICLPIHHQLKLREGAPA